MRRVLAAAVLVLLTGCSYLQEPGPYRAPGVAARALPADGERLYQRDCSWCHGPSGAGTAKGPPLVGGTNGEALTHFMVSTGRMPIDEPDERVAPRDPYYDEDQMRALAAHVATFSDEGPEIPELDLAGASLLHGLVLYQENCAACHSTTGVGGSMTPGKEVAEAGGDATRSFVVPPVTRSTPVEVAEAVRTGPGGMPVFGDETFDDEELADIVAYVEYLGAPDDRGGAGIGRIGPVAEGAIGWFIGLGVLLLFARWMGTKRGEL